MKKKIPENSDKMKIDPRRDPVTICFLGSEHRRCATSCMKPASSNCYRARKRLPNVKV